MQRDLKSGHLSIQYPSTPVNVEHDGLDGPNKRAGQRAAGRFHETEILTSCPGPRRLVPKFRETSKSYGHLS